MAVRRPHLEHPRRKQFARESLTEPGDYILRARVTDGAASTMRDIKVVVTGQQP